MIGTVGDLFPEAGGEGWRQGVAALQKSPALEVLTENVAGRADLMTGPAVFKAIAARIPELLQLDLGDVLLGAWAGSEALRRYADPARFAPGETVLVELAHHSISSSHRPRLDIVVDGVTVDSVPFELELTLSLDGAVLTIRNGKIGAVSLGPCEVAATLGCDGQTIVERESGPLELPASWTPEEPIAIAPPERDRMR